MGYERYLIELLRPLGAYDLSDGTVNRAELARYGQGLDAGSKELEQCEREMLPDTAEGFGLERLEELLPYRPVCRTTEQRRLALAALLRIGGDSFTPAAVNDALAGCGINAKTKETGTAGQVEVWFPDTPGIPEGFERMKVIIEDILPCHLGITYVFWYLTWGETSEKFSSWEEIKRMSLNWERLRAYVR